MKPLKRPGIYLLILAVIGSAGCRSPYYADRGAALGGVAGGLTGAALGDRHGNAAAGAVFGTAVGALTGAAVGDSIDADMQRREAMIEARTGTRMARRVTTDDVMSLTRSGLSDDVIVKHIQTHGVAAALTPGDIIRLHDNGVSENVINTMQQAAAQPVVTQPVVTGPPVVIRESYVAPPYWRPVWPCPAPPHHRSYARRPGVSWGISFAN